MVRDVSNRFGCRQSIPSISIASCAGVRNTLPSRAEGPRAKRPRSSRFVSRHRPSPVDQSSFYLTAAASPEDEDAVDIGSSFSAVCTFAARPLKPLRISVIPATSQIFCACGKIYHTGPPHQFAQDSAHEFSRGMSQCYFSSPTFYVAGSGRRAGW